MHSASAMLDANEESFGLRTLPTYHFDQADVVVSFAADFIGIGWMLVMVSLMLLSVILMQTMSRHYH